MGFMQQEIIKGDWYVVETANGVDIVPADLVALDLERDKTYDDDSPQWGAIVGALMEYLNVFEHDDVYEVEFTEGYGARMQAPGYMDCTEWSVFDTQDEAQEFLDEFYGEDTDD